MREISFRSKRTDNGEWIEGYVYRISEKLNPFIMLKNVILKRGMKRLKKY